MKCSKLASSTAFALASLLLSSSVLADHYDRDDYRSNDYRSDNYRGDNYRHYDNHRERHHHDHHPARVVVQDRVVVQERVIFAPVTYARPIYRTVAVDVPVDSCHVETTAYREPGRGDSFGGTVVGGLIGAAIGKEVGHGGGRSMAVGGLIGAAIGNDMARGGATRYVDREVCSSGYRTEYRQELVAYDVGYSYGGRIYHTERHSHPGAQIRLDINPRPY